MPLPAPATNNINASVLYGQREALARFPPGQPTATNPARTTLGQNQVFTCFGGAKKGETQIVLDCSVSSMMGIHQGGWYVPVEPIMLASPDGQGTESLDELKAPKAFLTPKEPPPPPPKITFPKITGMPVVMLSEGEILSEADESADKLYQDFLQRSFGQSDDRAYLIGVTQRALRILALARRRFEDSSLPVPGFIEEFDTRFSDLLKELGGKPFTSSAAPAREGSARLLLVGSQRASHADSATVQSKAGHEPKALTNATADFTDFKNCLDQMKASQNHQAKWTLRSEPQHATVTGKGVFARKSEPEQPLGETNLEGVPLQRLTWVFRAKWADGCTRSVTINPYSGVPLVAEFRKADGCEKP